MALVPCLKMLQGCLDNGVAWILCITIGLGLQRGGELMSDRGMPCLLTQTGTRRVLIALARCERHVRHDAAPEACEGFTRPGSLPHKRVADDCGDAHVVADLSTSDDRYAAAVGT
jgi:hypothetical protein